MNEWIHRSMFHRIKIIGMLFAIVCITTIPYSAQAYRSLANITGATKLPNAATIMTVYYNQINTELAITDSGTWIQHAINQWDFASWYEIFGVSNGSNSIPANTDINNMIRAALFDTTWSPTPCSNIADLPISYIAFSCPGDVTIHLNSSAICEWNTAGNDGTIGSFRLSCLCWPTQIDLLTTVLHELGHIWGLAHPEASNPPSNVMVNVSGAKQELYEDDKRGATQYYGPETSFESNLTLPWFPGHTYNETLGHDNWVAYKQSVSSTSTTIATAQTTITPNVIPYSGSKMRKIYGFSTNNYSFVYFKVFSAGDDEVASNFRYLTITPNMKLSWYQYSHAQRRMSVDILFTDGTVLRDCGLTDQYGICVHPACRDSYSNFVWRYFEVNLSSLQGKTVKDIMIAYDNGNNGGIGVFRGYFDNVRISY